MEGATVGHKTSFNAGYLYTVSSSCTGAKLLVRIVFYLAVGCSVHLTYCCNDWRVRDNPLLCAGLRCETSSDA